MGVNAAYLEQNGDIMAGTTSESKRVQFARSPEVSPAPNDDGVVWVYAAAGSVCLLVVFIIITIFLLWRRVNADRPFGGKYDVKPKRKSNVRFATHGTLDPISTWSSNKSPPPLSPQWVLMQPEFDSNSSSSDLSFDSKCRDINLVTKYPQPRGSSDLWFPNVSGSLSTADDDDSEILSDGTGRIWYSLNFDPEPEELTVTVIHAKRMQCRSLWYTPRDTFVRIYLLPEDNHFHQTKIRRGTIASKFNESFKFKVPQDDLISKTLKLSLYDVDKKNIRHCLGHAIMPLASLDLSKDTVMSTELDETVKAVGQYIGEMSFALCCNPFAETLRISLIRVKNLDLRRNSNEETEVYVTIEIFHGYRMLKRKTTGSQSATPGSVPTCFKESFQFAVGGRHLEQCSIAMTLYIRRQAPALSSLPPLHQDNDKKKPVIPRNRSHSSGEITPTDTNTSLPIPAPLTPQPEKTGASHRRKRSRCPVDEPFGRVTVGPFLYARGEQLKHWNSMIANPRVPLERWHTMTPIPATPVSSS